MKTILLADDEPNLRTLVRTTLEDPGYRILEASSGTEVLELVQRSRPDILLLDWMMPGMSGIEILEMLRSDPATADIAVIMLTAKGQQKDRTLAMAKGCQHFLVKPFSPLELMHTVRDVLRNTSLDARALVDEIPGLTPEMFSRLEQVDSQIALYARDLKRACYLERARSRDLAEANARLESVSRLKTEFLSFICHELRTPLNAMAALDLYDPAGNSREQAEVIELVRGGYDRLHRFIEKGLQYFQWVATGRVSTSKTGDLTLALKRAVNAIPELRRPEVHFEVRHEDSPLLVQGRESDLEIVVKVLLENALKYSPSRKRVLVELRRKGERVLLCVSDRGVGLRSEMLQEIFQPFTSGDLAHHSSGSGLSLALASVIVEAHGGSIQAESEGPGKGSNFLVELPAASVAAESRV